MSSRSIRSTLGLNPSSLAGGGRQTYGKQVDSSECIVKNRAYMICY
jgi:hypothetical protein